MVRKVLRRARDAEDMVQDACLRAMKYIDTLHAEDGRAWFLTIVRRAFYGWRAHNRPAMLLQDHESAVDALADEADNPEQVLVRKIERLTLAQAVAALPMPFREVIVLHELEDRSCKEITRITDVPLGMVMARLPRARRLLQGSAVLRGFALSGTGTGGGRGMNCDGARIDHLDRRPVALLVYRHGQHLVEVYVPPLASASPPAGVHTVRGFNVAVAQGAQMSWLATSDLSAAALAAFTTGLATGKVHPSGRQARHRCG